MEWIAIAGWAQVGDNGSSSGFYVGKFSHAIWHDTHHAYQHFECSFMHATRHAWLKQHCQFFCATFVSGCQFLLSQFPPHKAPTGATRPCQTRSFVRDKEVGLSGRARPFVPPDYYHVRGGRPRPRAYMDKAYGRVLEWLAERKKLLGKVSFLSFRHSKPLP